MANAEVTQAFVLAGVGGADVEASQAFVYAATAFPSPFVEVTQAFVAAGVDNSVDTLVSQAFVFAATLGRTADPRVRAWTFTLDGHDFYVLHLGTVETLVYDTYAQEWYVWGSTTTDIWRAYTGTNWIGGRQLTGVYGSDIVVGDDSIGTLYVLDPESDFDEDAVEGGGLLRAFERQVTAQFVVTSGYSSVPCFGIQAYGSIGQGVDGQTVSLEVSDNRGIVYDGMGTPTLDADDYDFRLEWPSLGSMRSPGRLFRITDTGALHRIDGIEMVVPDEQV